LIGQTVTHFKTDNSSNSSTRSQLPGFSDPIIRRSATSLPQQVHQNKARVCKIELLR
jgi:hypothetical protein